MRGDEEGRDAGDAGNDADVQDHVGDVVGLRGPEGVDELT